MSKSDPKNSNQLKLRIRVDKRGFVIKGKHFFPLGFNYWPRDMAVYLWPDYNSKAIARDMQVISQLGGNCIRMFIRWEDLNPEHGVINEDILEKFDDFLAQAKKNKIKVVPCLLIGHMSGQDWFPEWFHVELNEKDPAIKSQTIPLPPRKKEQGRVRDIYTDPLALENSKLQIRTILARYKDNKTILSWDLSNENQYWMPPETPEIGTAYMKEMFELMREIDPNHPVTYGMGKPDEGGSNFISFGPNSFAQYNDYYSVHVYPFWLYPMSSNLMDFYICYRPIFECYLAKLSGIPVQLQEFGMSDMYLAGLGKQRASKIIEGYFNVTLWDTVLNQIPAGVMSWCFCDFLPALADRNPYDHKRFELYFGVVDKDYNLKPSGKAFTRFAKFINEIDIFDFSLPEAKIAIVLPDNYNSFPGEHILQGLPSTKKLKELTKETNMNHNKALFSAFIFLKMGHFNFEFTSLYELDPALDQYQAIFLPNLYTLSEKSLKKCIQFLEQSGKKRLAYFSSNVITPQIFSEKWVEVASRKKLLKVVPLTSETQKIFTNPLELKYIRAQCHLKTKKEGVLPIFGDLDTQDNHVAYQRMYKDNKAIYFAVAPEINHSFVKNSYQRESGNELYQKLLNSIGVTSDPLCNNPLIETGILYNQQESEAILIVINHDFSEQKCQIQLNNPWKSVKEFYNSGFETTNNNTFDCILGPYGVKCFLLDF